MLLDMTQFGRHAPPGTYPNHLREWRKLRGFSQRELSIAANLGESTLSLLENGRTGFTRPTLQKLSDVLKVSIADILGSRPGDDELRALITAAAALPEPRRTRTIEIIQRLVEPEPEAAPASPPKGRLRSA